MEKYIFKMEPEDFIRKVIELYREARMSSFYHPKLKRGQSRVIYNLTEDLMAYFLAVNLTEDYDFYIDQPITFEGFIFSIYMSFSSKSPSSKPASSKLISILSAEGMASRFHCM